MSEKAKNITKQDLSKILGFSDRTRSRFMNVVLYEELKKLGYQKSSNILNAKVVKFMKNEFLIEEN